MSSYRLCFLFPMVALAGLPGTWRARRRPDRSARSDVRAVPGALANRILFAILRAENDLIARAGRLPWGSSVFAIGRKR